MLGACDVTRSNGIGDIRSVGMEDVEVPLESRHGKRVGEVRSVGVGWECYYFV